MTCEQPRVSVVTPVFNDEHHLSECIESVLRQTYQNWDYTIVNNCSTDRSLEVAERYAAADSRIRVHNNREFVRVMQNHNIAVRQISPDSMYCKVVFADDWLFPECLTRMVEVAEANPSVGIVSAYGLRGDRVAWDGLAYPSTFVCGREIGRATLSGGPFLFGSPTSILIRAEHIRRRDPFFNESNIHADTESCYEILTRSDFGFVHQVLTYTRVSDESLTSFSRSYNTYLAGQLSDLVRYGPAFLSAGETEERVQSLLSRYYRFLAVSLFKDREKAFWAFHREKLLELGYPLRQTRLLRSACIEAGREAWRRVFS